MNGDRDVLRRRALVFACLFVSTAIHAFGAGHPDKPLSALVRPTPEMIRSYANLPMSFEANRGQTDSSVKFLSRGAGYTLFLTRDHAILIAAALAAYSGPETSALAGSCQQGVISTLKLVGANRRSQPEGIDQLPGTVNYFIGNDPKKWRTGIPTYTRVRYRNIYPGIDLLYYGNHRELEYDFVLAPGADAKLIRMRFDGVRHLQRAANGDLVASAPDGALTLRRPLVYQVEDGRRVPVHGKFVLAAQNTVRFRLGRYDRSKPLVIDPVLMYSTFLGGKGTDTAYAIAVDSSGEAYIAGSTSSTNFPVTPGAFQPQDNAAANQSLTGFVAKLNAAGTALVYATYLGGSGASSTITLNIDSIRAIAVDSAGDAYVTGTAGSTDFPVTQGAFQTTNKAAANEVPTSFVTELNPTGTALVYSTYLGGSGSPLCTANCSGYPGGDTGYGIAVDTAGEAFVTGQTYSTDFPVTSDAFQTTNHAAGAKEYNAFITKMNAAGTALVYSTYLGGSGAAGAGDSSAAIAVDSSGNAYVAGETASTDFPVTSEAFQTTLHASGSTYTYSDAFVSELNPTGTALVYSTFLGGSSSDFASGLAIDTSGNAYITGTTSSSNFPVTSGAFQTADNCTINGNPCSNAFITKVNPSGSALVYSTHLGGSGGVIHLSPTLSSADGDHATGIAIDSSGDAYVTGKTPSSNFPMTTGAYQSVNNDQTASGVGGYNAFITELNPMGTALVYSTYLGGNGWNPSDLVGVIMFGNGDQANALALDSANDVYVAGAATSSAFPVTGGTFQMTQPSTESTFVAKLNLNSSTAPGLTPTVTASPAPATVTSAQPIAVTVAVSGSSGSPTPTGAVQLSSTFYTSPFSALSNGSVTFDISGGTLPAEPACYPPSADILIATYIPDSSSSAMYEFSSGLSGVYVVAPCFTLAPQVTTVTAAQAQSQDLPMTLVGSAGNGLPTPTGTATLTAGSYTSTAATLSGGGASFSIPAGTLTASLNNVWVNYSGDSNYVPVTPSAGAIVNVVSGASTGFTISGTSVTVKAGATTGNASTITVTAFGNFKGDVYLTAAITSDPSGASYPPTFSFSSSDPIVGVSPGTTDLVIATTAPVPCTQTSQVRHGIPLQAGGAALACLLFFFLPLRRRGWEKLLGMVLLLMAFSSGMLACGGSSGGGSCKNGIAGTTPGTYTISLTGTSGLAKATGTVSLVVQ